MHLGSGGRHPWTSHVSVIHRAVSYCSCITFLQPIYIATIQLFEKGLASLGAAVSFSNSCWSISASMSAAECRQSNTLQWAWVRSLVFDSNSWNSHACLTSCNVPSSSLHKTLALELLRMRTPGLLFLKKSMNRKGRELAVNSTFKLLPHHIKN